MAIKQALREFQTRLAQRMQEAMSQSQAGSTWLAVEAAGHGFLLPLAEAGEIFMTSGGLIPVPHSQPWFLGVANLRGHLHGVVDLGLFLGLRHQLPSTEGVRVQAQYVTFSRDLDANCALRVDRLAGLRHQDDLQQQMHHDGPRPNFVHRTLSDSDGRSWHELSLVNLARNDAFLRINL